jgi:hypothetical protein
MKTALIATTRAFSSDFKSLYEQMAFLREEYDRIYLIHTYSTNRIVKFIEETAKIKIQKDFSINHLIDEVFDRKWDNWEKFFHGVDISFLDEYHIDDIWFFGPPLSDGGNLKRGKLGIEKNFQKNSYMRFKSINRLYLLNHILLKIANHKKAYFHELCYDPGEASVNELTDPLLIPQAGYTVYHGYDIPELGMKRHNCYQYGLVHVGPIFPFSSKDFDIVFGYSYMNKERKKEHESIQKFIEKIKDGKIRHKIMYRSKIDDIDTLVSKDEYMSLIAESRFTLVIPAYHKGMFSCFRFIESIFYDCLPLIFDHCNYKDFFASYNIDQEYVKDILINDSNIFEAVQMNENRRLELIQYFKDKLFVGKARIQ